MVSAFVDMEDALPNFISSAASQKAKFSPGTHTHTHIIYCYVIINNTLFTSRGSKCTELFRQGKRKEIMPFVQVTRILTTLSERD